MRATRIRTGDTTIRNPLNKSSADFFYDSPHSSNPGIGIIHLERVNLLITL